MALSDALGKLIKSMKHTRTHGMTNVKNTVLKQEDQEMRFTEVPVPRRVDHYNTVPVYGLTGHQRGLDPPSSGDAYSVPSRRIIQHPNMQTSRRKGLGVRHSYIRQPPDYQYINPVPPPSLPVEQFTPARSVTYTGATLPVPVPIVVHLVPALVPTKHGNVYNPPAHHSKHVGHRRAPHFRGRHPPEKRHKKSVHNRRRRGKHQKIRALWNPLNILPPVYQFLPNPTSRIPLAGTPFKEYVEYVTWTQYLCQQLLRAGDLIRLQGAVARLRELNRGLRGTQAAIANHAIRRYSNILRVLHGRFPMLRRRRDAMANRIFGLLQRGLYSSARRALQSVMQRNDYLRVSPSMKDIIIVVGLIQYDGHNSRGILPLWSNNWHLSKNAKIAALIRAKQLARAVRQGTIDPQVLPPFRPFPRINIVDARALVNGGLDVTSKFSESFIAGNQLELGMLRMGMLYMQGDNCGAREQWSLTRQFAKNPWQREAMGVLEQRLTAKCARQQAESTFRAFCQAGTDTAYPIAEALAPGSISALVAQKERMFWTQVAIGDCRGAKRALYAIKAATPDAVFERRSYLKERYRFMKEKIKTCRPTQGLYSGRLGRQIIESLERNDLQGAELFWRRQFSSGMSLSLITVWRTAIMVARYPKIIYAPCVGNSLLTNDEKTNRQLFDFLERTSAGQPSPCRLFGFDDQGQCHLLWMRAAFIAGKTEMMLQAAELLKQQRQYCDEANELVACATLCTRGDACLAIEKYAQLGSRYRELAHNFIGSDLAQQMCRANGPIILDSFYIRDGPTPRPVTFLFRHYYSQHFREPAPVWQTGWGSLPFPQLPKIWHKPGKFRGIPAALEKVALKEAKELLCPCLGTKRPISPHRPKHLKHRNNIKHLKHRSGVRHLKHRNGVKRLKHRNGARHLKHRNDVKRLKPKHSHGHEKFYRNQHHKGRGNKKFKLKRNHPRKPKKSGLHYNSMSPAARLFGVSRPTNKSGVACRRDTVYEAFKVFMCKFQHEMAKKKHCQKLIKAHGRKRGLKIHKRHERKHRPHGKLRHFVRKHGRPNDLKKYKKMAKSKHHRNRERPSKSRKRRLRKYKKHDGRKVHRHRGNVKWRQNARSIHKIDGHSRRIKLRKNDYKRKYKRKHPNHHHHRRPRHFTLRQLAHSGALKAAAQMFAKGVIDCPCQLKREILRQNHIKIDFKKPNCNCSCKCNKHQSRHRNGLHGRFGHNRTRISHGRGPYHHLRHGRPSHDRNRFPHGKKHGYRQRHGQSGYNFNHVFHGKRYRRHPLNDFRPAYNRGYSPTLYRPKRKDESDHSYCKLMIHHARQWAQRPKETNHQYCNRMVMVRRQRNIRDHEACQRSTMEQIRAAYRRRAGVLRPKHRNIKRKGTHKTRDHHRDSSRYNSSEPRHRSRSSEVRQRSVSRSGSRMQSQERNRSRSTNSNRRRSSTRRNSSN